MKTVIAIIGILAIVTILVYIMISKYKEKDFSELVSRVKLWWGMVAVFSISTLFSPNVSIIALMFLSFFALKEFFSMNKTRKNDRRIYVWAYIAIPVQFWWAYTDWYGMFIVFIPVYVFLFLPLVRISTGGTQGFLKSVSTTHWGIMLMVFGLSHLAIYPKMDPKHGANLVLYLVLLTQLADVVQYMISKTIGKRLIIPTANPTLTTEGLISSVILTVMSGFILAPHLTPMSGVFGALSGLLISITSFIGKMNISFVKRDLLLEESSKDLLPKESFLSRIDSLSYTAPLFLHFIRYFFPWI